jgi:hypothetical protein
VANPTHPPGRRAGEAALAICTVALRRTVRRDGKSYGLGEIIRLPSEEASRLQALGFLASSTAPATSVVGVEPPKVVTAGWRIGIAWNRPVIAPTVGIFGDQVDHQSTCGAAFPITGVFDEAFIELTPHGPGGIDTENFVMAYPAASASRCRCSASSSPSSWGGRGKTTSPP